MKNLTFKWQVDQGSLALLKRLALASGHKSIGELFSTIVSAGIQGMVAQLQAAAHPAESVAQANAVPNTGEKTPEGAAPAADAGGSSANLS